MAGKKKRLTFFECPCRAPAMIDLAKIADLVLLMVDASFGFEMETFEFLNILQVHGFPKVIGVLTHLDRFRDNKRLRKTKKRLKQRFWTEIYDGAKLFYLSGLVHGKYPRTEIHNLGLFISRAKFRPLSWRNTHPYVVVDRLEDITPSHRIEEAGKSEKERLAIPRRVVFYGYARGTHLKGNARVHIPGAGDFVLAMMKSIDDPCPLPGALKAREEKERERREREYQRVRGGGEEEGEGEGEEGKGEEEEGEGGQGGALGQLMRSRTAAMAARAAVGSRRSLTERDTILYAPMSDVGNVMLGKDAMYIDITKVHFTRKDQIVKPVKERKRGRRGAGGGTG